MNELGLQFFSFYHCERRPELCVVVGRQYCILNEQHLGITLQVKKMKKEKENRERERQQYYPSYGHGHEHGDRVRMCEEPMFDA